MSTNDHTAQWEAVSGYSKYEVSRAGVVRNKKTKKALRPSIGSHGYHVVNLCLDGDRGVKQRVALIHRIVAQAFVHGYSAKLTVNHRNGIKTDNRIENLEWVSNSENVTHAHVTGLYRNRWNVRRARNGRIPMFVPMPM